MAITGELKAAATGGHVFVGNAGCKGVFVLLKEDKVYGRIIKGIINISNFHHDGKGS